MNNLHKIQVNNLTEDSYALIWYYTYILGVKVGMSGNALVQQDSYYTDGHWNLILRDDIKEIIELWKNEGAKKIAIPEKYKHIKM